MAGLKQSEGARNGNWVFSPDTQCLFFVTACCLFTQCTDDYGSVLSSKEAAFSIRTEQGPGTGPGRGRGRESAVACRGDEENSQ